MRNFIVRRTEARVDRIGRRVVREVRVGDRRRHRVEVFGVRVGIAKGPVDAVVILLREAEREDQRAALFVRVGQQEVVRGSAVDRTTVRSRTRLRIADRNHLSGFVRLRIEDVGHDAQVVAEHRKAGVHISHGTEGKLPFRRQLEVRIEGVYAAHAAGVCDGVFRFIRNIKERHARVGVCEIRQVRVRRGIVVGQRHAVVRIVVRKPDVRVAAREQTEATVQFHVVHQVVVEAEARLDQVTPVHVGVITIAVIAFKCSVVGRLVAGRVVVVAQAHRDIQLVADLPFILEVDRVDFVAEFSSRVVHIVRASSVRVLEVVGNAICEVSRAVEAPLTQRLLNEEVEHGEFFALETCGEQMVAHRVVGSSFVVPELIGELVGMTAVVCTEIDGRRAGFEVVRNADLNFAPAVKTSNRDLTVVEVNVRCTKLGREVWRPVRVKCAGVVFQFCAALVIVVAIGNAVRTGVRRRVVRAIVIGVGEFSAVIVVDVPVQLAEELFIFNGERSRKATGDITILVHSCVDDALVQSVRQTDIVRLVAEDVCAFELFVGTEEEQFVLDDRAADIDAVTLLFEAAQVALDAIGFVAGQRVVGVVKEQAAVELVRAGFRHSVDVTSGERTVVDVERSEFNRHLLDGVVGERDALGWVTVGVQAEVIVQANTVDGQRVVARVGTGAVDRVVEGFVDIDTRVEANDVLDVAVHCRSIFQRREVVGRGRAGGDLGDLHCGTGDDNRFHAGSVVVRTGDRQVEVGRLAEVGVNAFGAGRDEAFTGDGDAVWAADTQALTGELASSVGGCDRNRAGRLVKDGDGGARNGRASFVGDRTADRRGRNLCRSDACCRNRDGRYSGSASEFIPVDHDIPLSERVPAPRPCTLSGLEVA